MRLDTKKGVQFRLPLAEQRLRYNQQNTPHALGHQLGNDQAGLDCLPQADFVGENATALRDPAQGKYDSIDLMRIWIDTPVTLACCVSALFVRPPQTNQIFG
jgi:hypothetical protein